MNTRMKKVAAGAVVVSLLVLGVVLLTVARGAYGMMRTSAATSCPATAGAQCSMSASQCAAATASGTCPATGRQGTAAQGACPMRAGTVVPACHAAEPGSVG
ncbi:MAG: hypothetical protein NTX69_06110 [Candidatus Bipolaricaulota bacterium]|nr:hypothetical protein [Candidatus Bipolaricaulota bacterium]